MLVTFGVTFGTSIFGLTLGRNFFVKSLFRLFEKILVMVETAPVSNIALVILLAAATIAGTSVLRLASTFANFKPRKVSNFLHQLLFAFSYP